MSTRPTPYEARQNVSVGRMQGPRAGDDAGRSLRALEGPPRKPPLYAVLQSYLLPAAQFTG